MNLNQEDRESISSDLAFLCKLETKAAIGSHDAEFDAAMFGSRLASIYDARTWAERRLLLLPRLTQVPIWHKDFEVIKDCIKELNAYINHLGGDE